VRLDNLHSPDTLDPRRSALVVFDMLERYRGAALAAGAIEPVRHLLEVCRSRGVLVCYARADHRADGADLARTLADTDPEHRPWTADHLPPDRPAFGSGSPELQVLAELAPRPEDIDVPKHRWSAFAGTKLDTVLRAQDRRTVLLVGGSTHVGIASTAYAARDMDYQVVVVRDGCTGLPEQRDFFLDRVFPRICRVRTVAQVEAMLATRPSQSQGAPVHE
jgi:nicotinamidase-related amidase